LLAAVNATGAIAVSLPTVAAGAMAVNHEFFAIIMGFVDYSATNAKLREEVSKLKAINEEKNRANNLLWDELGIYPLGVRGGYTMLHLSLWSSRIQLRLKIRCGICPGE
jgi:hypothetical protein